MIVNEIDEGKIKKEKLLKEIARLDEEAAECKIQAENHQERITNAQAMQTEGRAMQAEGRAMQAEAQAMRAQVQAMRAEAQRSSLKVMTRQFHSIFSKEALSDERVDEIFDKYLCDGSITVEDLSIGRAFSQINSMQSVIQYLKDIPGIKACDFRHFKTAINDIQTFAEYLKTEAAYSIKGIAFKNYVSDSIKEVLAETVATRATTAFPLKVQYSP